MEKKENIGMETREMIKVKDVSAVSDQATNASSKFYLGHASPDFDLSYVEPKIDAGCQAQLERMVDIVPIIVNFGNKINNFI